MVEHIVSLEKLNEVLEIPGASVLDISATWCGPCKVIGPQFELLSDKFPDIRFYKADLDECEGLADILKVNAVPTFSFFKDGRMVSSFAGANMNKLVEELTTLSKGNDTPAVEKTDV